jgi:hypothetical protein
LSDTGTSFSTDSAFLTSIAIEISCPGWYVVESRDRERLRPLADVFEAKLTPLKSVVVGDVVDEVVVLACIAGVDVVV